MGRRSLASVQWAFHGGTRCSACWCALRARPDGIFLPGAERWRELGFLPSARILRPRSRSTINFAAQLESAGAEVLHLPAAPDLSLDAVYTHDPSLATDHGLIGLNPGKPNRVPESRRHVEFCGSLGIPAAGQIHPPGKTEAGDMVWLDSTTLLIGQGYRTNAAGIAQMRALLQPHGVEVISAPLPYGSGPVRLSASHVADEPAR